MLPFESVAIEDENDAEDLGRKLEDRERGIETTANVVSKSKVMFELVF